MQNRSTSTEQRIEWYQNLLLLASIPFILVGMHTIEFHEMFTFEERQCKVYHENAAIGNKCEK